MKEKKKINSFIGQFDKNNNRMWVLRRMAFGQLDCGGAYERCMLADCKQ